MAPRRRAVFGVTAAAATLLGGCGSPHRPPHRLTVPAATPTVSDAPVTASPAATATTKRNPSAPTSLAHPTTTVTHGPATAVTAGPTGVGTIVLDVVDRSRPTVQYGRTISSSRALPTIVRYPAVGPSGAAERSGAPAARGPWPLVIFAHGYDVTPSTYAHLLHAWANAGFVVAAPTFPLEAAGGPLDENDLNNEPRDISVVISSVLAQTSGPLAGVVSSAAVAVAGHSDGAEAALAAGFVNGDPRIGAVVSMAAQGIIGGPHPDARHPLLVVQGDQDTINPPARADAVYAAAGAPKYYLRLLGGGHLPPVASDTPWRPIVEQVGIDFLRRSNNGAVALSTLEADGRRPGLSTLTADP
jgi:dienelactone hydrolase